MNREQPVTNPEIPGVLKRALDDLERVTSLMQGVIVALDDIRISCRHEDLEPGPWDDDRSWFWCVAW